MDSTQGGYRSKAVPYKQENKEKKQGESRKNKIEGKRPWNINQEIGKKQEKGKRNMKRAETK